MSSENHKNLISLSEAGKLSGYHQNYLAFLCREGKLGGEKIGRNWVIEKNALMKFMHGDETAVPEEEIAVHNSETSQIQVPNVLDLSNNISSEVERLEKSIVFINNRVTEAVEKIGQIESLPKTVFFHHPTEVKQGSTVGPRIVSDSSEKQTRNNSLSKFGIPIISTLALGVMAVIMLVTNSLHFELGFQSGPVSYIKKVVEHVQVLSATKQDENSNLEGNDIVVNVTNVQNPTIKESTGKVLGLNTAVSYTKEVQVPISEEYLRSYMDRYVQILFDNKTLTSPFEKKSEPTVVTQNIQTLSNTNPVQTLSNNLAPVYIPVGVAPPNPQNNSNGALLFSATNISGENFTTNTLKISGISGTTQCLQVDTNGLVNGTGSACGSGGGGSSIGGVVTGATAGSVLFAGVGGALAQDNANIFWDDAANKLGIGTNTPTNKLSVVGSANVTGHTAIGSTSLVDMYTAGSASFPSTLHVSETITSLDSFYGASGINNEVTFNPSSGSNLYGYGLSSEARTQAGNATNFTELFGTYNFVGHYGSGNVTNIYADLSKAYNYQTAGSVGSMYAYYAYPYTDSRPVTDMYSFYGWPGYSGGGTVTNGYGVYIDNSFGSPITNSYGAYIAGQTAATNNVGVLIGETGSGTKNTNLLIGTTTIPSGSYSVYNSSVDNNYFAGNLGLGDISPVALLTVGNGDLFQVNSSGVIAAAAGITSSGTITFSGLGGGGTQCVQVSNTGVLSGTGGVCGGGSSTLQSAYDADVNGSDTTIALTTADDSIIISNPSSSGTDSAFAFKVDQLASGNVAGVVISQAGTGNLLTADSSNSSGNGASIDVQSSSSSQYALSVTSNNGATTGLFVRADGNVGIGTNAPAAYLDVLNSNPAVNDSIYWRTAGQISGILSNSGGTGAGTMILKDGSGVSTARIDGKTGNANYINNAGNFGLGTTSPSAVLDIDSVDAASITSEKIQLRVQNTAQTLTDGTTIANWRAAQFLTPTINGVAGGGTETVTNAATIYIDGAPSGSNITITNPYALWVDAGVTRLDGNLQTNVTGSTQCLQADTNGVVSGSGGACGGSSSTLTQSYDADANGSDATIALTSADDSIIISNPSSLGTDSSFAFKVDQLATGALDSFVLNNAGTGTLLLADNSNASGNGVSIDVQSSSSSQYALKVTSNNGATNGLYVRADGNVGIGTTSPTSKLQVTAGNAGGSGSSGSYVANTITGALNNNFSAVGSTSEAYLNTSSNSGTNTFLIGSTSLADSLSTGSVTNIFGSQSIGYLDGAGTVTNLAGIDVFGGSYAGTVTNVVGGRFQAYRVGGTVTNLKGVEIIPSTGAATNVYGVYVGDLTTGTNNYGVYLNQTSGANNYAIYSGGAAKSYFAGSLGIGAVSPQAQIEVAGADTADATLALSADRSDDAGDTWFIKSLASGNALSVLNEATEVLNLTTAGALQIDSNLTVSGLGGAGTKCIHVDNSGTLSTTASDCGSGSAASLDGITAAVADDTDNDNTNKQIAWDWSTPTTQTAFKLQNTGTGLTSGSILNVSSATTSAVATNGIVSLNATGNYSSTSNVGLLQVAANATTAGTVAKFSGTALTTGTGVALVGGTAMTTGSVLQLASTTYNHGNATETGSLVNVSFTDATNGTATSTTNGINISPTINVTTGASGTKTINGVRVSAPTLTACTGGSTCVYTGVNVASAGTLANTTLYSALFNGGNVGIGTTAPAQLLTIASASGSATIAMQLEDSAQNGSSSRAINWRSTAGTVFDYAKIRAEYGNSYVNSKMIFSTGNTSSVLTDRMALDVDGDLGIQGNTSPSYPLSFAASTGDKIALYGGAGYGLGIQSNLLQIYANASTDSVALGYGTSASFTPVLTTKTSFVGIGNTSPDSRIDIAGNITGNAWGLNGIGIQVATATYTDGNTVISGSATDSAIISFGQPTINATNTSVTTSNAYGMYVAGAPISGTNQTLTNTYGIRVASTSTTDGAGGAPTNSYGLYVDAPTGATNNYAAIFQGGNVGIGTTNPTAQLMIVTSDAAKVPIIARRVAFQTADIQQWQDENGTTGLAVDPYGVLYAGSRTGTNLVGYNTYISGGYGTGNAVNGGSIEFQTPDPTGPGTTLQAPSTKMILYNSNLGIGTTTPSTILALGAGADRTIQVERRTTNNNGNNLTVQAGGAKSASTNFGGGDLVLASGISTGSATSNIQFQVPTNSGGSGTTDRTPTTAMTIQGGGNVGIGSTNPGANLDIVSAATTGIGERITASSLTSGNALSLIGPTSSGVTGTGSTAGFLNVTSDVGTAGGTAGVLAQFNPDYNGGTYSYGVRVSGTDSTTNTNTLYNMYSSLDVTNNGTKTGVSTYGVAVTSSTTANSMTGGFFVADSTGAVTSGTQTMVGVSGSTTVNGANTSTSTTNMYGGKFTTNMYNTTTGTVNSYGIHASASSILSGAGVANIYGAYIDDGGADGTGTSTKYGIFVKNQTGADNNYAAIFEGGTVGIGTTTPTTTKSLDVQGEVQINFPTTGATTIGVCKSQTDGTAANNDLVECSGTPGDLAEWYETNEGVETGDVVSSTQNEFSFEEELFDPHTGKSLGRTKKRTTNVLAKSTWSYSKSIFGVVSESPLQTLGDAVIKAGAKNPKPIALVGRVPVKISTENGSVKPGDYLTASSKFPGFAMKATRSGNVIGTAIGYFPPQNLRGPENETQAEPISGEILVFVRPTYAVINNTFVLESSDTTQLMNTENGGVKEALENTFLINQKGNDTIFQLQQNNIDRLLVQSNGSMQLLTSIKCDGTEKRNNAFTPRSRMSGDGCDNALTIKANDEEVFAITAVGDVKITGRILVGKDTAGIAKMNARANRTTVTFATPYPSAPVIIATPQIIPTFSYGVVDVTPNGFTIATNVPVEFDTNFSWVVVYQPESTLSVSGAPVEVQAPIMTTPETVLPNENNEGSPDEPLAAKPTEETTTSDIQ